MSMKWPLILVLLIGLDALSHQKLDALMNDEESMCVIEKISDSSICSDDLLVIYLDLGNAACAIIPRCHQFRRLLSQEWGEPSVQFVQAEKGKDLQAGVIQGTVLSEYRPPTPPSGTGYHRYQFFLYEQPDDNVISLNKQETKSFGCWDLDSFVSRFNLGSSVASTQLMTQNFED
ncbi:phosphatidylethanolamine-binding protein 4 isoform X12 [Mustelus asterias]